jgi:hypothetical protein
MPLIKRTIPNAIFVDIIRDGRDVALSLGYQRSIQPFPWDCELKRWIINLDILRPGAVYGARQTAA